jgi:hypothetical protein
VNDFRCEIIAMLLPDSEGINAQAVGERRLLGGVPDDLRVGNPVPSVINRDAAERVSRKLKL